MAERVKVYYQNHGDIETRKQQFCTLYSTVPVRFLMAFAIIVGLAKLKA